MYKFSSDIPLSAHFRPIYPHRDTILPSVFQFPAGVPFKLGQAAAAAHRSAAEFPGTGLSAPPPRPIGT